MLTKLCVKLRGAVLSAQSPDFKACANGYCHTYFDVKGIDPLLLAMFPINEDIQDAALQAMEECESLLVLLGINPSMLQDKIARQSSVRLPAIGSWYSDPLADRDNGGEDGNNSSDDGDDESCYGSDDSSTNDAAELQEPMDQTEGRDFSCSHDDKLTWLTCAATAITSNEMAKVYVLYFMNLLSSLITLQSEPSGRQC